MDETSEVDGLVLPPIPLATGSVLVDDAGVSTTITAVTLQVRTADGREHHIPLEHRHGAWWAPEEESVGSL